ncbi:type IV pilin [Archaeoglobales archaeon]|nr:MAG: type IV pilin [Archaeoglobales archaeon]
MFRKDEKAVSPVIGVILMVAITVILAAVIASFVFGMGSSVKKQYTVAAAVSQADNHTIVVTYQGGPDHDSVDSITVKFSPSNLTSLKYDLYNESGNKVNTVALYGTNTTTITSPSVGDTITYKVNTSQSSVGFNAGKDHVVVSATFSDGTSQVILDTYV